MVYTRIAIMLGMGSIVLVGSSPGLAQRLREPEPRNGACFYEHSDYRGMYFCLERGETLTSVSSGMNDQISAIRLFGNAEVTVYEDSRFRGDSEVYADDVASLRGSWNDTISSIRVQGSNRASSSGRGRQGGRDVERIVRRAYQDILDREPDTAGFRLYRSRMIDDGWTEQQVRNALRESPEYREKNTMTPARAREIVRAAYLAVLNREPDAGARGYIDRVLRDEWTRADVERALRNSAEYRNR